MPHEKPGKFQSVKLDEYQADAINRIRKAFEEIEKKVTKRGYPQNKRYLALTLTKLEEACMFATKSITHN